MLSSRAATVDLEARLILEPLAPEHAPALFLLLNDWDIVRMLAQVPWPPTRESVEAFAARQDGERDSDDFAVLASGTVIGCGGVKRPGSGNPPRKMPRLGYWIGKPHWNRGFGRRAVAALVAHGFRKFPQERIGAGVFLDNPASLRVLEKLGFEPAGRYETSSLSRGVPVETIDMQLSRTRWEAARP
jgi:RimJ/RimL family protein N-acetyltransferase